MQLLDSDWPANILAGSHFRAQETRALSPDGVCAFAGAPLGTRLCSHIIVMGLGELNRSLFLRTALIDWKL